MKNMKQKGTKRDEDLYKSSDISLQFEPVERNKRVEATHINYANSWRGRFASSIDRLIVLLQQGCNNSITTVKRWVKTLSIKSIDFFRSVSYNAYCNINHERIKNVKSSDNTKSKPKSKAKSDMSSWSWASAGHVIMGIVNVLVVVSILLSAYTILIVNGLQNKLTVAMVAPMVAFAAFQLLKQFIKGAK